METLQAICAERHHNIQLGQAEKVSIVTVRWKLTAATTYGLVAGARCRRSAGVVYPTERMITVLLYYTMAELVNACATTGNERTYFVSHDKCVFSSIVYWRRQCAAVRRHKTAQSPYFQTPLQSSKLFQREIISVFWSESVFKFCADVNTLRLDGIDGDLVVVKRSNSARYNCIYIYVQRQLIRMICLSKQIIGSGAEEPTVPHVELFFVINYLELSRKTKCILCNRLKLPTNRLNLLLPRSCS